MRLSPLVLSVRGSGSDAGGGQRGSCRFCGLRTPNWRGLFSRAAGEDAAACALCHLVRHLDRETIDDEAVLIWLPEMTQAALNALARGVHLRLAAHGALHFISTERPAGADVSGPRPLAAALSAAFAMRARSGEALTRLGTTSPRALGQALARLKTETYAARARLLGGLRLWLLGRFYREGEDIYAELLATPGS